MHTTSASLLLSLRKAGQGKAWSRFVRMYSPMLYSWARRRGLQEPDALDLVQDVFATLVNKLPEFNYDKQKSFRAWLWTITSNKWRERRRRLALPFDSSANVDRLPDGVSNQIEEAEFRRHLISQIVPAYEHDFQRSTWASFWENVVDGKPAAQIAKEHGISVAAVHQAKLRVLTRLREELGDLIRG